MSSGKYVLEVYEPGEYKIAAGSFEYESAPPSISEGDLLDPLNWRDADHLNGFLLEVVRVIHLIGNSGGPTFHKMCVATKKVPKEEARLKGLIR
jgi:hypothetical protein